MIRASDGIAGNRQVIRSLGDDFARQKSGATTFFSATGAPAASVMRTT